MKFPFGRPVVRSFVVVGLFAGSLGFTPPAIAADTVHISTYLGEERAISQITVRYRSGVDQSDTNGHPTGTSLVEGVTLGLGSRYPNEIVGISINPAVSGTEAERIAQAIEETGTVEFADVMYPLESTATDQWQTCSTGTAETIDDSCLARQTWYLDAIGAPSVWGTTADAAHAVVAVIDSGSLNHPDLSGQWVNGRDMIGASRNYTISDYENVDGFTSGGDGDGADSDPTDQGQGRTGTECHMGGVGYRLNPGANLAPARDSNWHGTAVASIIAATQDNQIGMSGVSPHAKVQAVRALGRCTETDDALNLVRAIDWASGETVEGSTNATPAHVINMSLGAYYGGADRCPTVYQEAITRAINNGTVVVASAGNEPKPAAEHVPSSCAGVISVGATNKTSQLSSFSSTDPDLSAPGGELGVDPGDTILVASNTETGALTNPTYSYKFGSGTSFSAPMVSSAIAMAVTKYKTAGSRINPASLKAALVYSASLGQQCDDCGAGILHIPTFLNVLATTYAPTTPLAVGATATYNSVSKLNVTWDAPQSDLWNPVSSYTAKAYDAASGGNLAGSCSPSSLSSRVCAIEGLAENTTYYVSVTAAVSASTTSDRTQVTTNRRAAAPTNVVGAPGPSSINVSWTAPTDWGNFTSSGLYEVLAYTSETGTDLGGSCYSSGSSCEVSSLNGGTPYWISVTAMTGLHPGGAIPSARLRMVTTGTAPTTTVPTTTPPTTVPASPSTPKVKIAVGKSLSAVSALSKVGLKTSKGSKTSLSVPSSQKATCKVVGATVKLLKKGSCTVNVTLKPTKGKSTTKKLTLTS